jgi:hypothetical protein
VFWKHDPAKGLSPHTVARDILQTQVIHPSYVLRAVRPGALPAVVKAGITRTYKVEYFIERHL